MPADEWNLWLASWETTKWGDDRLTHQLAGIGAKLAGLLGAESTNPQDLIPRWYYLTAEQVKARAQAAREAAKARFVAWCKSREAKSPVSETPVSS